MAYDNSLDPLGDGSLLESYRFESSLQNEQGTRSFSDVGTYVAGKFGFGREVPVNSSSSTTGCPFSFGDKSFAFWLNCASAYSGGIDVGQRWSSDWIGGWTYSTSANWVNAFVGASGEYVYGGFSVTDGWHLVSVVYTESTKTVKLYVDDVEKLSKTVLNSPTTSSSSNISIAQYDTDKPTQIDQIMLFNKALTVSDIQTLMAMTETQQPNVTVLANPLGTIGVCPKVPMVQYDGTSNVDHSTDPLRNGRLSASYPFDDDLNAIQASAPNFVTLDPYTLASGKLGNALQMYDTATATASSSIFNGNDKSHTIFFWAYLDGDSYTFDLDIGGNVQIYVTKGATAGNSVVHLNIRGYDYYLNEWNHIGWKYFVYRFNHCNNEVSLEIYDFYTLKFTRTPDLLSSMTMTLKPREVQTTMLIDQLMFFDDILLTDYEVSLLVNNMSNGYEGTSVTAPATSSNISIQLNQVSVIAIAGNTVASPQPLLLNSVLNDVVLPFQTILSANIGNASIVFDGGVVLPPPPPRSSDIVDFFDDGTGKHLWNFDNRDTADRGNATITSTGQHSFDWGKYGWGAKTSITERQSFSDLTGTSITIMCWAYVQTNSDTNDKTILEFYGLDINQTLKILVQNDGVVKVVRRNITVTYNGQQIAFDDWQHIAVSINDMAVSVSVNGGYLSTWNDDTSTYQPTDFNLFADPDIQRDAIRVFNRALTIAEIQEVMTEESSHFVPQTHIADVFNLSVQLYTPITVHQLLTIPTTIGDLQTEIFTPITVHQTVPIGTTIGDLSLEIYQVYADNGGQHQFLDVLPIGDITVSAYDVTVWRLNKYEFDITQRVYEDGSFWVWTPEDEFDVVGTIETNHFAIDFEITQYVEFDYLKYVVKLSGDIKHTVQGLQKPIFDIVQNMWNGYEDVEPVPYYGNFDVVQYVDGALLPVAVIGSMRITHGLDWDYAVTKKVSGFAIVSKSRDMYWFDFEVKQNLDSDYYLTTERYASRIVSRLYDAEKSHIESIGRINPTGDWSCVSHWTFDATQRDSGTACADFSNPFTHDSPFRKKGNESGYRLHAKQGQYIANFSPTVLGGHSIMRGLPEWSIVTRRTVSNYWYVDDAHIMFEIFGVWIGGIYIQEGYNGTKYPINLARDKYEDDIVVIVTYNRGLFRVYRFDELVGECTPAMSQTSSELRFRLLGNNSYGAEEKMENLYLFDKIVSYNDIKGLFSEDSDEKYYTVIKGFAFPEPKEVKFVSALNMQSGVDGGVSVKFENGYYEDIDPFGDGSCIETYTVSENFRSLQNNHSIEATEVSTLDWNQSLKEVEHPLTNIHFTESTDKPLKMYGVHMFIKPYFNTRLYENWSIVVRRSYECYYQIDYYFYNPYIWYYDEDNFSDRSQIKINGVLYDKDWSVLVWHGCGDWCISTDRDHIDDVYMISYDGMYLSEWLGGMLWCKIKVGNNFKFSDSRFRMMFARGRMGIDQTYSNDVVSTQYCGKIYCFASVVDYNQIRDIILNTGTNRRYRVRQHCGDYWITENREEFEIKSEIEININYGMYPITNTAHDMGDSDFFGDRSCVRHWKFQTDTVDYVGGFDFNAVFPIQTKTGRFGSVIWWNRYNTGSENKIITGSIHGKRNSISLWVTLDDVDPSNATEPSGFSLFAEGGRYWFLRRYEWYDSATASNKAIWYLGCYGGMREYDFVVKSFPEEDILGKPIHIVIVNYLYDNVEVYVNGEKSNIQYGMSPVLEPSASSGVSIGGEYQYNGDGYYIFSRGSNYVRGGIENVRQFNKELSDIEVLQLYYEGAGFVLHQVVEKYTIHRFIISQDSGRPFKKAFLADEYDPFGDGSCISYINFDPINYNENGEKNQDHLYTTIYDKALDSQGIVDVYMYGKEYSNCIYNGIYDPFFRYLPSYELYDGVGEEKYTLFSACGGSSSINYDIGFIDENVEIGMSWVFDSSSHLGLTFVGEDSIVGSRVNPMLVYEDGKVYSYKGDDDFTGAVWEVPNLDGSNRGYLRKICMTQRKRDDGRFDCVLWICGRKYTTVTDYGMFPLSKFDKHRIQKWLSNSIGGQQTPHGEIRIFNRYLNDDEAFRLSDGFLHFEYFDVTQDTTEESTVDRYNQFIRQSVHPSYYKFDSKSNPYVFGMERPSLLYKFDGDYLDAGGRDAGIYANGAMTYSDNRVFGTKSAVFGSDMKVKRKLLLPKDPLNSEITFSFWFKKTNDGISEFVTIMADAEEDCALYGGIYRDIASHSSFAYEGNNWKLRIEALEFTIPSGGLISKINIDSFTHIVVTVNRTEDLIQDGYWQDKFYGSHEISIYVNGELDVRTTSTIYIWRCVWYDELWFGHNDTSTYDTSSKYPVNGVLDQLRVFFFGINEDNVKALYKEETVLPFVTIMQGIEEFNFEKIDIIGEVEQLHFERFEICHGFRDASKIYRFNIVQNANTDDRTVFIGRK